MSDIRKSSRNDEYSLTNLSGTNSDKQSVIQKTNYKDAVCHSQSLIPNPQSFSYSLSQIAKLFHADYQGKDATVSSVSIDTRTLQKGDLFFAIKGENFDGHQFAEEALKKGACAVVADQPITHLSAMKVNNTIEALGILARDFRKKFSANLIAITGSCGKTTTRSLAQSIFSQAGNTLASIRSFNNNIGVPLTVLQLTSEHRYAVLELGANHIGEIFTLVKIIEPMDVAVITKIAPIHIEGFGSLKNIAQAKFEITQGLSRNGTLVISYEDDKNFWGNYSAHSFITFSMENPQADVYAERIQLNSNGCPSFNLKTPQGACEIILNLIGRHHVHNALAAACSALAKNISLEKIKKGLEKALPVENRLTLRKGLNGANIIDDAFNSNPFAMKASIDLLMHYSGKHILVMGDMLELGEEEALLHGEIGVYAKTKGVDELLTYGNLSRFASSNFGKNAYHFESREELIKALKPKLTEKTVVLVKASHGMKFEGIVRTCL